MRYFPFWGHVENNHFLRTILLHFLRTGKTASSKQLRIALTVSEGMRKFHQNLDVYQITARVF